ncbi:MAG: ABC transporter permease [Bryobacterales bacterium]|nr:ABC transporter permease [Bryobacterales bacterium]
MRMARGESLRLAVTAVWAHRFRSLLTILGIVIGITTVVTVASLLTGLRKGVVVFFNEFGPDNIFLNRTGGDPNSVNIPAKQARRRPLRPEYAAIIKRQASAVEDVGISLYIPDMLRGQPITARVPGFESDNTSLIGHSANLFRFQPRELRSGRLFTAEEDSRAAAVCVLGASLADALFPDGRPLGRNVLVAGSEYTVIGVFAEAKGGFFGENGLDRVVNIPLHTAEARFPQVDRYLLTIHARNGYRQDAFDEVEGIVRRIRRTPEGEPDDFSLTTPDQIVKQFDNITGLIVMVSIAISAMGLLVGGIGVMNIMLVSVTERTKEIGVCKAVGARRLDIILQFLLEAVTLTGAGGVLGILFAIAVTLGVNALLPNLPSEVPMWAVIAGFATSVSVGLLFGVWPAVKAAGLDPVEALRYE